MSSDFFPQWYWTRGLHDATIVKVEHIDTMHHSSGKYYQNCLRLHLDTKIALFDTTISTINFYNYKILSNDIDLTGAWWLSDTIRTIGTKYLLEIQVQNQRKIQTCSVRFTHCEVERLQ